jgi:MOSC domain-containing protein YiiM
MNEIPSEGDFEIVSLNVAAATGIRKKPVESVRLVEGLGMEGDAHAGLIEERQVSLLAIEEIEKASAQLAKGGCALTSGLDHLVPGDFAENITTRGVQLHLLPLGTRIAVGGILLEVSKIGKECHAACEIRRLVGDCVMPRKGIFVRVLKGGEVKREDRCHYCF